MQILIADDSDIVRQLLKTLLPQVDGWSICGEAANGQHAILLAHQLKPDLAILDLAMPLLDGLHAAAEIVKFAPSLPIVLYTLHKNSQIELAAKKVGIRAVVSKSDDSQVLLDTVTKIVSEAVPASRLAAISETLFTTLPPPNATEALAAAADDAESAPSDVIGAVSSTPSAIAAATETAEEPAALAASAAAASSQSASSEVLETSAGTSSGEVAAPGSSNAGAASELT